MYYSDAYYWARCKGKVKTTGNMTCTTELWSGCPTDNSNCILKFTTISELSTVGTGPYIHNPTPIKYSVRRYVSTSVRRYVTFPCSHVPTFRTCNVTSSCDLPLVPWLNWCKRLLRSVLWFLCLQP